MIKNDEIIFNNNYEIKLYSYIEEHNEYEFEFYLDQLTTEMMLEVHILSFNKEIYTFNTNIDSRNNNSYDYIQNAIV
jgi:hypothetical protein